jgi:hypothetical protein
MSEIPKFFVPAATEANTERVYAGFAKSCGVPVPAMPKRIFSITFRHDGGVWTATVGKQLTGTKYVTKGRGSNKNESSLGVSDPAIVLAIFPGNPYMVSTSGGIVHRTVWANPFLAGVPDSVIPFSI